MKIGAVLLAGGESRRMGQDKAMFFFQGKPLWQIQLDLLRKLEPAETLVSARTDPAWRPADVQFVPDAFPSRGPLSGLVASLDRISTSHLLALAVDMPWMTEKYLKFLCAEIKPGCGVVPKIDDRVQPVAAIYPREAAVDFHNALKGANFSLQTLVRGLAVSGKVREISVTGQEERLFLNLNAFSDLPK